MSLPNTHQILIDQYGRKHNYLRIALTERCNLRCFYCMPEDGVEVKNKAEFISRKEILTVAKEFVRLGGNKIRLTGGEPLARKDVEEIIRDLALLPVELALTTNGVLIDRFLPLFKELKFKNINISLDSLDQDKNLIITKRNYFIRVMKNIELLCEDGIHPKVNTVIMNGVNDDELFNFIDLTKELPIEVRFIEFMPFKGNNWNSDKCISYNEIIERIQTQYGEQNLVKLEDAIGSTSRGFKIKGHLGTIGIISSVSNPFCSGCNRIRLTADGKLKNCLFSTNEWNILEPLRNGDDIKPVFEACILSKKELRAGIATMDNSTVTSSEENRSMILIGG
jgi:molybdenum cofactor biosynthesis protein A